MKKITKGFISLLILATGVTKAQGHAAALKAFDSMQMKNVEPVSK